MNVTSAEIHPAWLNCVAFLISRVQIDFFFFHSQIEIGKLYFSNMKPYISAWDRLLQQNNIQIKLIFYAHKENIHQPCRKLHFQIQCKYAHFYSTIVYFIISFLLKILKHFKITWSHSTPVR